MGATPVDFSPLTCEPGTWSGSPSFTYTFQVENASAQALQSAPTNVLAPLPVSGISAGLYRATATRLPDNERITFTGVVTNAAGLRPARLLVRSTTLHPPAKKKKTKSRKH